MSKREQRAEHTAEHIFMASLVRILPRLKVKKVEHLEDKSYVYVTGETVAWKDLFEAEKTANKVIAQDLEVKEHHYETLSEAKQAFPALRSHDERISGRVRIIEVDGYDYSACSQRHVKRTGECGFFIATGLSKADDGSIQIEFRVGEDAVTAALEISKICMETAEALGATYQTLTQAASNLRSEASDLRRRLTALTLEEVEEIPFVEEDRIRFYSTVFKGLDAKRLMKKVGELIEEKSRIVIVGNKSDEEAILILARSDDISFDCGEVLRKALAELGGRGGGRAGFAFGSVPQSRLDEALNRIKASCRERR